MPKKYHIKHIIIGSLIIVPSFSLADEVKNNVTEEPIELGKVIVMGTQQDSKVFKVEQTAQDISKNMVQSEQDLFRHEVGIGVTESGRSGSNGFAIRGVDKDRVAVIVDGLPQAETFMPSIYKGYGYFNGSINNTEYENISEVQVNKGANSVQDGSGAVGGSVRFTTKSIDDFVKPNEKLGLFLKAGYSSKNYEGRRTIGAGFKVNDFFGFAQLTHRHGHETVNNGRGENIYGSARGKPDPQTHRSRSLLTKLGYQLNNQHKITAFYEDRHQKQNTEEKSFDSWGTYRFADDTAPYQRYGLEYDYVADADSWLDAINIVLAEQKINMKSDTYNVSKYEPNKISQNYFREFEQTQKMVKAQLFAQPFNFGGQEHTLQAKLEYRDAHLKNSNHDVDYLSSGAHASKYSIMTPVKSRIFALSIQDDIRITPQFLASVGLRYDSYQYTPELDGTNKFPVSYDASKKTFAHPSWQVAMQYDLTDQHQIGYKIGTGFRAPKVEEIFFEFGKGGANHFMPNTDLKPETALNQEITYLFKNEYSEFGLGAFHSKYRNFIDERVSEGRQPNPWYDPNYSWGGGPYLYVNQIQFVNVARASISGLEVHGAMNGQLIGLSENFNFNFKGQYSRGRNQDGDGLKSIQPWTVLLGAEYEAPSKRWNTSLTARYTAAKKGKDTKETMYSWRGKEDKEWQWLSSSYVVVDLTSQIHLDKDITLNLGVFNLFNRNYTTWDSLRDLPTYGTTNRIDRAGKGLNRFSAPKRNFSISLEARF